MTTIETALETPRKPIRVWPGLIAVALQWIGWFVVPALFPQAAIVALLSGVIGGLIAVKVVTTVMNAAFARMYSSSAATEQELIGRMAEVTVPIPAGKTGEVTYICSSKRYASPAKAKSPDQEIKKGTKVFICDHQPNYVLVDLWTDTFIDPAFEDDTLTPQEKLAKQRQQMMQ